MVVTNSEMVTLIFIFGFIILSLIVICYLLYITFCLSWRNIRQSSPTDDSIPSLDVLYIPAISKGSSEDTSPEKNSNSNDDYDTERENKKDCSRIFFISKERTIKIKADESNRSKADTLISI